MNAFQTKRSQQLAYIIFIKICYLNGVDKDDHIAFRFHHCRPLRWRHNGRDGVSHHQPHDCFLNRSFRRRSKKTALAFVRGIHRWPVNFPLKCPVTWKMFPFGDAIMILLLDRSIDDNVDCSIWLLYALMLNEHMLTHFKRFLTLLQQRCH